MDYDWIEKRSAVAHGLMIVGGSLDARRCGYR